MEIEEGEDMGPEEDRWGDEGPATDRGVRDG